MILQNVRLSVLRLRKTLKIRDYSIITISIENQKIRIKISACAYLSDTEQD